MTTLQNSQPQTVIDDYGHLSTSDKLTFLWMVYQRVGQTVLPSAPPQPYSEMGHRFHQSFQQVSQNEQTQAMRDILEDCSTRFNRRYKSLKGNCRLAFWFELAQTLDHKHTSPTIKADQVSQAVHQALAALEELDAEEQLSVLQSIFTP